MQCALSVIIDDSCHHHEGIQVVHFAKIKSITQNWILRKG